MNAYIYNYIYMYTPIYVCVCVCVRIYMVLNMYNMIFMNDPYNSYEKLRGNEVSPCSRLEPQHQMTRLAGDVWVM